MQNGTIFIATKCFVARLKGIVIIDTEIISLDEIIDIEVFLATTDRQVSALSREFSYVVLVN
jgi:hypothetical protein